ncbi:MAG: hypothetical protein ABRQ35_05610 [Smithellaceae bacterium]
MELLSFIFEYGIWISIPVFVLSVALLIRCIMGILRILREARLFSVPLQERQDIEFTGTGTVILAMEGPLFSRRFAKLKYEMRGPDGMEAKSRPALLRATTTGFTKARMELRVYKITQPGRYVFHIHGLGGEKPSDARHCMVFMRPHMGRIMVHVIGIIVVSTFIIGSIVLFGLRLTANN